MGGSFLPIALITWRFRPLFQVLANRCGVSLSQLHDSVDTVSSHYVVNGILVCNRLVFVDSSDLL